MSALPIPARADSGQRPVDRSSASRSPAAPDSDWRLGLRRREAIELRSGNSSNAGWARAAFRAARARRRARAQSAAKTTNARSCQDPIGSTTLIHERRRRAMLSASPCRPQPSISAASPYCDAAPRRADSTSSSSTLLGSRTIEILRPGTTSTGAPPVVTIGTPAAFNFAVSAVTSRTAAAKSWCRDPGCGPSATSPSMFFHSMNVYVTDVPGIRCGSA